MLAVPSKNGTLVELAARFDVQANHVEEVGRAGGGGIWRGWKSRKLDEADREKLHAKIGQLTLENDFSARSLGRQIGRSEKKSRCNG